MLKVSQIIGLVGCPLRDNTWQRRRRGQDVMRTPWSPRVKRYAPALQMHLDKALVLNTGGGGRRRAGGGGLNMHAIAWC